MLSTINSFKSTKSNHEYQIKKYVSAMSCRNSSKSDGIIKLSKKINDRNLDGIFRLILLIYGATMKK